MRRAFMILFVLAFLGCSDDDKPQRTEVLAKACEEGGVKRASGSSWTCSDGCNRCGCNDGVLEQTAMFCGDTGDPFMVDSFMPAMDTSAPPADTSVSDSSGG